MVSALLAPIFQRNQQATCYIGNVDKRVTQQILWQLFMQCGPVVNIHLPRDKITNQHNGFGFVEFRTQQDANYSIKIMHLVKLHGKAIKVNKASQDKRNQEIGAKLYIGNLSNQFSDQNIKEVFSKFGITTSTWIMRDENGVSLGYAFVNYDNFQSADLAIQHLNGQFIGGRAIQVNYAMKKDSKGEKHGSVAERIIAANRPDFKSAFNPSSVMNTNKVMYENSHAMSEMQQPPPFQHQPPPPPSTNFGNNIAATQHTQPQQPLAGIPPPPSSYPPMMGSQYMLSQSSSYNMPQFQIMMPPPPPNSQSSSIQQAPPPPPIHPPPNANF